MLILIPFKYKITDKLINADFIIEMLDELSLNISNIAFVVLDNARVHTAHKVKQLFEIGNKEVYISFIYPLIHLSQ